MKCFKWTAFVFIVILVSACSANHKSIYRHEAVTKNSSLTSVDAKQRAVISTTSGGVRQFCSEPSPDVFSVVAQALSAGGVFGNAAESASIEAALNIAFSDSEQGSTIPRTQTINMLRELMFRTCERHLNGAYNSLEMSVQAIRDQRLMVSILAIEQITGAISPKPLLVGAMGSSAAGPGDVAIVRLDDALKAKSAAEINHDKAKKDLSLLNGEDKECDDIAEAAEKVEDLTEDQKDKKPKCDEARMNLVSAEELLKEKADHYADLRRLATVSGLSASTDGTVSVPGGLDRAHSESVVDVAETVKQIVELNFDKDTEVTIFCFKALTSIEMRKIEPSALTSLQGSCIGYLGGRVELAEQDLREEIRSSQKRMERESRELFDRQWNRLKQLFDNGKKKDFIEALQRELITPERGKANCFEDVDTKDEYLGCFAALPFRLQRNLPEVE